MATYQSIKHDLDYGGKAGALIPLLLFTSDGSDATASFASKIDSTFDEYLFIINNLHSENDNVELDMNGSSDTGSNYNVTKTVTYFEAWQNEAGTSAGVSYNTNHDMAQGTGFLELQSRYGSDNDQAGVGLLRIFNPASTTFVKHFLYIGNQYHSADYSQQNFVAGYFNTTSVVDAIQFKMSDGEIQGGTIGMFGVH
mgnify:FL=1